MILLEEKKDLFFVDVRDHVDVRRNVLEAQKEVVEGLQRYENIKFLREKKLENITKLRGIIKGLFKSISDLKAALPQTKLREAIKIKKKSKPVKRKTEKKEFLKAEEKKETEKPKTELEKLESELSAIESKLTSLK